MGENLETEGREAVRSPMQWAPEKNGGFSAARPSALSRPVTRGPYGPEHVNAAEARRDEDSLLHHITRLAKRRRESPELGWGSFEILGQPHEAVLAHRVSWEGVSMVLLHNLSPDPVVVPFELPGEPEGTELVDLLDSQSCTVDAEHRAETSLDGYGHRWLRVRRDGDPRLL